MGGHDIDHDPQAQTMGFGDQRVEISKRAVFWMDVAVVRHVIAKVLLRRLKEWRNPNGVDTQTCDIVQAGCNARQIADAIPVGILKRPWVDLIDNGGFPPL